MKIEEEYVDVLQNIEFLVVRHFRLHPNTTDYFVSRVYEALVDSYVAEKIGRQPRAWNPSAEELELFEQTRGMCNWWLGRSTELINDAMRPELPPRVIDLETLQQCLKRLQKSVQTWTKRHGRQGYLQFIAQYIK